MKYKISYIYYENLLKTIQLMISQKNLPNKDNCYNCHKNKIAETISSYNKLSAVIAVKISAAKY